MRKVDIEDVVMQAKVYSITYEEGFEDNEILEILNGYNPSS